MVSKKKSKVAVLADPCQVIIKEILGQVKYAATIRNSTVREVLDDVLALFMHQELNAPTKPIKQVPKPIVAVDKSVKKLRKAKSPEHQRICFELLDKFSGRNIISLPEKVYHTVYVIRHKPTGMFYIGMHSSTTKGDLLKTYFTSSDVVSKLISADGSSSFYVEKVLYFSTRDIAYAAEQAIIRFNLPELNPYMINMAATEFGKIDSTDRFIKKITQFMYHDVKLMLHRDCPLSDTFKVSEHSAFKSVKYPQTEHDIMMPVGIVVK
jgi:hypothetical protein